MAKRSDRSLIVGLDIGTSKVVALVGEIGIDGSIEVVGLGSHPSRGLKKGVVVNIESTVQSIQRAVEEAELMAGCEIHSVYAGIAGSHVRSLNSHGVVAIRDREVTDVDVGHVIDAAKAVAIPADQRILHVLPQEFIIDGQEGIRDPIGMSGVRLEAKVHIVTGADSAAQNIVKCVQRCGLTVEDVVLEQLASAYAVLTDDEKELGVCIVDIGGGTTDIAVFSGGAIRHTAVIPIAGDQVTNDIAVSMRTPDAVRRRHQGALRLRAVAAGQSGREHRGAQRGRSAGAPAGPPDAGRGGRAALRGTVRPDPRRTAAQRLRGNDRRGNRADRRQRAHGRRHRPRRGNLSRAGAAGIAAARSRVWPKWCRTRSIRLAWGCCSTRGRTPGARRGGAACRAMCRGCSIACSRGSRAISDRSFQCEELTAMFEVMDAYSQNAVIKVIGVGGGGGNAVTHMVTSGIEGVEFLCVNTDAQALKHSKVKTSLQIGSDITKGLGAGANPDVGRAAALEDRERLIEMIEGSDMLFITAGMGGGTGTGAAPVVAQLAKELGILTVAVVTRPFEMEGSKRARAADNGIAELSKYVDSLITIPNQKLLTVLGGTTTLLDAFKAANQVLQGAVQGIAELITRPGLINVDFADVRTVMSETGMAMMGSGNGRGEGRARVAAEAAVSSPLLEHVDLADAHGILVNVTAGMDMSIGEFQEVGNIVKEFASDDATVVVGTVIDPEMQDELRVTVVATGLNRTAQQSRRRDGFADHGRDHGRDTGRDRDYRPRVGPRWRP